MLAVPLSTAAAEILLGLSVATALLALITGSQRDGWRLLVRGGIATRFVPWLWLAFVAWYLVSTLFAVDPASSVTKLPKLIRYALFFMPLLVPWRARHWQTLFRVQGLLLVILIVLAAGSLVAGASRATTSNLHYNTLAQVAAAISLLLLAAALFGPASARGERRLYALGSLLATILMVATLSRAAYIAWGVSALALLVARLPRRWQLATVLAFVVVPLVGVPILRTVRSDAIDLQNPEFARRYDMWQTAVSVVRDYPLTGLGDGGIGFVYDDYKTGMLVDDPKVWNTMHNDLLTVAVNHGLPASAIWLTLWIILDVALVRGMIRQRHGPGSWLKAGFLGIGTTLHMYYLFGLVHDNYAIYLKSCTLLLLWGMFVAAERDIERPPLPEE